MVTRSDDCRCPGVDINTVHSFITSQRQLILYIISIGRGGNSEWIMVIHHDDGWKLCMKPHAKLMIFWNRHLSILFLAIPLKSTREFIFIMHFTTVSAMYYDIDTLHAHTNVPLEQLPAVLIWTHAVKRQWRVWKPDSGISTYILNLGRVMREIWLK